MLLTDQQPSVPIFVGLNAEQRENALAAGEEPAYTGTYTSAAKIVLQSLFGWQRDDEETAGALCDGHSLF